MLKRYLALVFTGLVISMALLPVKINPVRIVAIAAAVTATPTPTPTPTPTATPTPAPVSAVQGASYGRQSWPCTSQTVPVQVMPYAVRGTYRVCNRSSSAGAVLAGDYPGGPGAPVPSSPLANWEEIPVGQCRPDGKDADSTINLAWGCVCEAASCAATIDSTWR